MGSRLVAHDLSVGDYADTSPASLGRRKRSMYTPENDNPSWEGRPP